MMKNNQINVFYLYLFWINNDHTVYISNKLADGIFHLIALVYTGVYYLPIFT